MAVARAIFQPMLDSVFHAQKLTQMLAAKAPKSVLISSAFVNSAGVRMLAAAIGPHAEVTRAFVGIRNGVSTLQGVRSLLDAGVAVHVVDTGSQRRIYHPKFYIVRGRKTAQAVVGSANLTYGGLGANIEASVELDLDLADDSDRAVCDDFAATLDALLAGHPANCYRVPDAATAQTLFDAGLLEDETSRKFDAPVGVATGKAVPGTSAPTIKLPRMARPPAPKPVAASPQPKKPAAPKPAAPAPVQAPATLPVSAPILFGPVVWVKSNLPRSDLQFPGKTGNATGVLRLTQAHYEVGGSVIDQTRYFRRTVFAGLAWTVSGKKEVASANFTLSIAGVVVGTFPLDLSHDPAWEAGQGNYTTGLHWGPTIPYIRDPNLVGRTLTLHAPSGPSAPFAIEID